MRAPATVSQLHIDFLRFLPFSFPFLFFSCSCFATHLSAYQLSTCQYYNPVDKLISILNTRSLNRPYIHFMCRCGHCSRISRSSVQETRLFVRTLYCVVTIIGLSQNIAVLVEHIKCFVGSIVCIYLHKVTQCQGITFGPSSRGGYLKLGDKVAISIV